MMKIKIVMLLTIGMLLSVASYAQKVKVGNGVAEIDCTGMKGVSTTTKGFKNSSTDKTSSGNSNEYTSDAANQSIYYKFEVTSTDVGNGAIRWSDALQICRGHGDGKWRLPTHRELVLILVLNPELVKAGNYTSLAIDMNFAYWSATDFGPMHVWAVGTFIGSTEKDRNPKNLPVPPNKPNRIRCIRELP